MTNVLLICDSFTSANFYVMLSVIRSLGNVHIHAISAYNEKDANLPIYEDVSYYHVYNWRRSVIVALRKCPLRLLARAIEYVFCNITSTYDMLATSIYERNIYKECQTIINNKDINSIFSVCFFFYAHRIAAKLHKKSGIDWFQFWLDPLSYRFKNEFLMYKLSKRMERRLLNDASKIYALPEVFLNSEIINDYRDKLVTFEIPYLENRLVSEKNRDVIFAGGFVKRVREPRPVLDLLLKILDGIDKDVKFHFYVRNKEEYVSYNINSKGRICFHDFVNHEELTNLLSGSYMLLTIGNKGTKQMPSKTVEYVSYRKPLLFFYADDEDASLRYLKDYPDICRINVDEDISINRKKIIEFINMKHSTISYDDLMKMETYWKSTPQYIRQIIFSRL